MMKNPNEAEARPSIVTIEQELSRQRRADWRRKITASALRVTLIAATAVVLVSNLALPVFNVLGSNMDPTLKDGDMIVSIKKAVFNRGDIITFNYNGKILIKRVIATGGDVVDIDGDGTVSVNGLVLDEPYLPEEGKGAGKCDLELPFTVPAKHLFIMGDNRTASLDSRVSMIGTVGPEQILGKAAFRLWPPGAFGLIK